MIIPIIGPSHAHPLHWHWAHQYRVMAIIIIPIIEHVATTAHCHPSLAIPTHGHPHHWLSMHIVILNNGHPCTWSSLSLALPIHGQP